MHQIGSIVAMLQQPHGEPEQDVAMPVVLASSPPAVGGAPATPPLSTEVN